MPVIEVDRVSKCFHLHPDRPRSFQELFLKRLRRNGACEDATTLWALRDVSFSVDQGETVGLIGSNGSGKSTVLKLLTRILEPTSGVVNVVGRVSALLELGAGFQPELTGRENVFLNGSVLGVGRKEMAARFDDIVEFAELERFIDVPVKVYSSGMYVRLGFATAISVNPEVLLIDEALAVGDQSFQEKCIERIRQLKASGVTIVFVSHDLDSVRSLCDRVVWLDKGRLLIDDGAETVLGEYLAHVYGHPVVEEAPAVEETAEPPAPEPAAEPTEEDDASPETEVEPVVPPDPEPVAEPEPLPAPAMVAERWGNRRIEITGVTLLGSDGKETDCLATGEPAEIIISYLAHERIEAPAFGVAIHREDGAHISGCNTLLSHYEIPEVEGVGEVRYVASIMPLLPGEYALSVATHNDSETETYDYLSFYFPFRVVLGNACPHQGLIHIPAEWRFERKSANGEAR